MRVLTHLLLSLAWVSTGCSGEASRVEDAGADLVAEDVVEDAAANESAPEVWATVDEIVAPYFAEGEAAAAMREFAARNWSRARQELVAFLGRREGASRAETARIGLLIALCDEHMGRWRAAARAFGEAAEELPVLADYLRYEAAQAHLGAGDLDAALDWAGRVSADSIHTMDARLVVGEVLRRQRRWEEAAEHYQRYLDDFSTGKRRFEARFHLAEALEHLDRAVPDAIQHYRRIAVLGPRSGWGKRAAKRMKAILRRMPRKARRRQAAPAAGDYVALGMVRYRKKQHAKAIAEFERALEAETTTASDTCVAAYHLANSWFRRRDRERSSRLFDAAWELCRGAGVADYQVKAAYLGGRSFAILGDWSAAAERFARAEKVAAANDHTMADDARVFQAEAKEMLGESAASRRLLAEVPALYPDGDMRAEALWRLAWDAYREQSYQTAIEWLKKQLALSSFDPDRKAHARAQYWMGRVHERTGDAAAAEDAYVATAQDYPLTYYALLALNRLREQHPERYLLLIDEIDTAAREEVVPEELMLRPRRIQNDPSGQRLVELLRLGLVERARAELGGAGGERPSQDAPNTPERIEAMWLRALLYGRAERSDRAVWITRWHAVDYKRTWPAGNDRLKWEIAYPREFVEPIAQHAESYGYPSALQLAIVREESGFNPRVESWANAIGLSQLIRPTARRFGREIGVRASRHNLLDPDKNLAIGARFISFLWTKWDGRVALIPPSYNAGEGAVTRWIEQRGDWPLDEWIEGIPGDQARRYTKRVLSSYFAYAYLADGTIPLLPNDPPGE